MKLRAAVALVLLAACGTQIRVTPTNRSPKPLAPRPLDSIAVFSFPPSQPFVEVAWIQAKDGPDSDHIPFIMKEAGRIGCDGVIMASTRQSATSWNWGGRGGFTETPGETNAVCIMFQGAQQVAPPAAPPAAPAPPPSVPVTP
jgi:hypothetical protein